MDVSIAFLVFTAVFFWADAKSLGFSDEMPKVLKDTMEQSYMCSMKIGPSIRGIPKIRGIEQLPEDNEALNKLWGCIWQKKGILDENNEVNETLFKNYLTDLFSIVHEPSQAELDDAQQIVDGCKQVRSNDYGLKAVRIQNCINAYISNKAFENNFI